MDCLGVSPERVEALTPWRIYSYLFIHEWDIAFEHEMYKIFKKISDGKEWKVLIPTPGDTPHYLWGLFKLIDVLAQEEEKGQCEILRALESLSLTLTASPLKEEADKSWFKLPVKERDTPRFERSKTLRGFRVVSFQDANGVVGNLQESSAGGGEFKMWLGFGTGRLHLSQSQVKSLLPHLEHFAETGHLPE